MRKKFEGGYAGEGKENKMRGVLRKYFEGGMPERMKNTQCGGLRKHLRGVCWRG